MANSAHKGFVPVQLEELHYLGAVLQMPVTQVDRLNAAGFVRWLGRDVGWVSTSTCTLPGQYHDDMLIATPGAFVQRVRSVDKEA